MTQLSRPFQVALVALVLFVAVWFVGLRGHSASPSGSSSVGSASAPTARAREKAAAAPSPVYHGPVPGLGGLTRAINKARGAVAESQRSANGIEAKARQVEGKPAHLSGASSSVAASPAATSPSQARPSLNSASSAPRSTSKSSATTHAGAASKAASKGVGAPSTGAKTTAPIGQVQVETALRQGKVAVVLFWNPKAADDTAVYDQLLQARKPLGAAIAAFFSSASQVASFGSITHAVPVYQTPTILIVNPRGQVTSLTGLTDAYAIEQAVEEARKA
jgi:hypothetical protein